MDAATRLRNSADFSSRPTLLCVPFAGAGASFYHPWQQAARDRWHIVPVELPGRERRLLEPLRRDAVEAARSLADELADTLRTTRTVLFGHSLGAVLAYELTHLLIARDVKVERLIVSGSPGPWTQRERRATGLPDEEFFARVEEFAGFRHDALNHPEMRQLILPALRADCEMHESYVPSTDEPLHVPICSIRGISDGLASADEAKEWQHATTAEFRFVEVPGTHMYLVNRSREVLDIIEEHYTDFPN